MEPRTKLQKQIVGLRARVPELTEKQRVWASKYAVDHPGFRRKKGYIICTECGGKYPDALKLEDGETDICPLCGAELKLETTKKSKDRQAEYFIIITTVKEFQLIRYFQVRRNSMAGKKADYSIQEVIQRWLHPSGKYETLARCLAPFSMYHLDIWAHASCLEIRKREHEEYNIRSVPVYPVRKYIPDIKRNGFNGRLWGPSVFTYLKLILTEPKIETLLKARQYPLLRYILRETHPINKLTYLWTPVKICIRNNYKIKDASTWSDYIKLLKACRKDLHNFKYVCPQKLIEEHNRFLREKRKLELKEEFELHKKEILESEGEYYKAKRKYLDINFSDELIQISVLPDVKSFLEEGEILHHCVFENEYYKKKESLILSARIDNKPIETVEVSLTDYTIVQAHGRFNGISKHHSRIIKLVKDNISLIKKAAKKKAAIPA